MNKEQTDRTWREVKRLVSHCTDGASIQDIFNGLKNAPPRRTLQY